MTTVHGAAGRLGDEAAAVTLAASRDRRHPSVRQDGQRVLLGVGLEVVGHLVPGGVVAHRVGQGQPGQCREPPRREEYEAAPARPPHVADPLTVVDDHEGHARLAQPVPHAEAGLPAADDEHVDVIRHRVVWCRRHCMLSTRVLRRRRPDRRARRLHNSGDRDARTARHARQSIPALVLQSLLLNCGDAARGRRRAGRTGPGGGRRSSQPGAGRMEPCPVLCR